MVQQAEASQVRINEFLQQVPEITNTIHTATNHTEGKGSAAFKNVTFSLR